MVINIAILQYSSKGGPGASGVQFLYQAGPSLAEIVENRCWYRLSLVQYTSAKKPLLDDIVSWDLRGVGGSRLVHLHLGKIELS